MSVQIIYKSQPKKKGSQKKEVKRKELDSGKSKKETKPKPILQIINKTIYNLTKKKKIFCIRNANPISREFL